jgi:hypothetical protein
MRMYRPHGLACGAAVPVRILQNRNTSRPTLSRFLSATSTRSINSGRQAMGHAMRSAVTCFGYQRQI